MQGTKTFLSFLVLVGACAAVLVGCKGYECPDQTDEVTCGYCSQDAVTSGNPHAGMCRYCPKGSTCSGDVCGSLACVAPGGGGGGGGGCTPTGCSSATPWLCGAYCYADPSQAGANHSCTKCP